jgi:hypothetical protein
MCAIVCSIVNCSFGTGKSKNLVISLPNSLGLKTNQFLVGKNKRASDGNVYDPKNLDEDFFENHTNFDRSLAIFDILYLNGHCFVKEGIPLKDRMKFLDKIMAQEDRSVIFISQKHLIQKA